MNIEMSRCKNKYEKQETLMPDTICNLYWFDVVLDQRVVFLCLWGWFGLFLFNTVSMCISGARLGSFSVGKPLILLFSRSFGVSLHIWGRLELFF